MLDLDQTPMESETYSGCSCDLVHFQNINYRIQIMGIKDIVENNGYVIILTENNLVNFKHNSKTVP